MGKITKIVLALAAVFTLTGYLLNRGDKDFGDFFYGFSTLLWIFFLLLIYQERTKSNT